MLCPPLENCSLSGNECPYGFQQDKNGCLLCQCLNSKFTLSLHVEPKGLKFQGLTCRSMNVIHFFRHAASCSLALKMMDIQRCIYLNAHAKNNWQKLGFDSNILMNAYLRPWLQSLQGSLSQECSCKQPHSISFLCLWWMLCPLSDDLSLNFSRWLLSWPGKILFPAMPDGIREGWFWLRGVWVQHPYAEVPTFDLH